MKDFEIYLKDLEFYLKNLEFYLKNLEILFEKFGKILKIMQLRQFTCHWNMLDESLGQSHTYIQCPGKDQNLNAEGGDEGAAYANQTHR